MTKRVLLVTNKISPYRIPLLNYISESEKIEFKGIFLTEKSKNRKWIVNKKKLNFSFEIIPGFHFHSFKLDMGTSINLGIIKAIKEFDPDIIITSGYSNINYLVSFLFSKIKGIKFILWNGSTLLSSKRNTGLIRKLKEIIIKNSDQYITYGTKAKEYLEYYGANPDKVHIGLNTVDIDYFYNKSRQYKKTKEFLLEREKYPEIIFAFVGQLIERKGIKELIEVFQKLNSKRVGLLIIGDGPEKNNIREYIQKKNIENIYIVGFVQKNEIFKYYTLADILLVPSHEEVWGLVVNEGLACGNYVVTSNQVGAYYDILQEDYLGISFKTRNFKENLENKMNRCIKDIDFIKRNRKLRSFYAVKNLSIERYANAFFEAINAC